MSSGSEVGGGEVLVVEGEGGAKDPLAVWCDAVEPRAANLGDEAVAAEFGDESGHAGASSSAFVVAGGGPGIDAVDEVAVAEAHNGVPSGQYGSEQGEIGWLEGIEAGVVTPVTVPAPAQGVEDGDTFAIGLSGGESFEVAP